jgi:PAS domain S-box-containing protein
MDAPSASPTEGVARLQGSLTDLISAMARPDLWTSGEPPDAITSLLDTLPGMLERIAQQTHDLAAANQALTNEVAERKRIDDDLREGVRESRLIVDSIPGLVALMSASGDLEVVNRQILEYFGQTLDELKRWGMTDVVHPDDLPHVIDVFTAAVAAGTPYDILQRFRRSDGVYRWFQNSGFPLRDPTGQIVRWCVLLTDIDDRKRAEDALRESAHEARLIVDSVPGMVLIMTATGAVEFVNRQILDFLGKTLEELNSLEMVIHPHDRSRVIDAWARSIATSEPLDVEHRVLRADGTYRWLHGRGLPLRDTSGNIVRWYTLLTDIDDRKHAEDAIRASERNLQLIIDTIPALAWSTRPDGWADFFNQHYLDFTGLSAEQASGWGWTVALHPDDRDGLATTWQRIMAAEAPGDAEARLRRHDGDYRWFLFRANPLRDESGAIVKWYGVNTDIEDRKRAEAELKRAYDSFADAQRLSRTGNFTADIVVDEHVWSAELYRIFEFDPATKISVQMVRDVIHPEDLPAFDAGFTRSLGGVDFDQVFRIVLASGTVKHVHAAGRVIERVAGRPLFIGAIQDVTENVVAAEALNRARSELAHVARVSTVSALTASIAHEVNQPLSGIITNASTGLRMLDADPPNVDGARETVRRTLRDGNRASEVITRLRALFSKKEFALEPLDLNEATREVIALSLSELQQHRVVLQLELTADLPNVTGDRIQLQQVILNLLRNASEAMVDVHDRPRQLLIKTEPENGDRVRLTVRDAGVGLPPQRLTSLFDPFATTKSDGMGIGLFVSRSIVERHHGRLWAEPNDGGPGAMFTFSIPREAESEPDAAPATRTS